MPSVMEKSGILSRSRAKSATYGPHPNSEDESSEEEHSHGETGGGLGGRRREGGKAARIGPGAQPPPPGGGAEGLKTLAALLCALLPPRGDGGGTHEWGGGHRGLIWDPPTRRWGRAPPFGRLEACRWPATCQHNNNNKARVGEGDGQRGTWEGKMGPGVYGVGGWEKGRPEVWVEVVALEQPPPLSTSLPPPQRPGIGAARVRQCTAPPPGVPFGRSPGPHPLRQLGEEEDDEGCFGSAGRSILSSPPSLKLGSSLWKHSIWYPPPSQLVLPFRHGAGVFLHRPPSAGFV